MANNTSPNKGGRPAGRKDSMPRSRTKEGSIRKTLISLQEMESLAIENIRSSLQQEEIDKEVVQTSKWLLTTIVSMNRAAIAEDSLMFEERVYKNEQKKEDSNIVRFSPKLIKYDTEEDDEE